MKQSESGKGEEPPARTASSPQGFQAALGLLAAIGATMAGLGIWSAVVGSEGGPGVVGIVLGAALLFGALWGIYMRRHRGDDSRKS